MGAHSGLFHELVSIQRAHRVQQHQQEGTVTRLRLLSLRAECGGRRVAARVEPPSQEKGPSPRCTAQRHKGGKNHTNITIDRGGAGSFLVMRRSELLCVA